MCLSDWIARSPPWAEPIKELQNHSADPLSHEQDVCSGNQFGQFNSHCNLHRPAWVELWSPESMNRDCWETWASTRQVKFRALRLHGSLACSGTFLTIRDKSGVDAGGVGPAADPLWPEGGCQNERAHASRPPVPPELLSFKPKQPGLSLGYSWIPSWNFS